MLGLYIRDSLCIRQSSGPHIRDFTRTRQISGLVFWEISCATQFSRPILRISVAPHKFRCRCQGFLKIQHTFRADIRDFSCTIQISGPIRGRQAGRFDRGAYVGLCTVVSQGQIPSGSGKKAKPWAADLPWAPKAVEPPKDLARQPA